MRSIPAIELLIKKTYRALGACDNPRTVLGMLRAAKYDNIAADRKPRERFEVLGSDGNIYLVKPDSTRYECFRKSLSCAACKRVGAFMVLTQNDEMMGRSAHFNLFAADGVLMTQDHVHPKSLGGPDDVDNLQTMCAPCNNRKGATIPPRSSLEVLLQGLSRNVGTALKRRDLVRLGLQELLLSDDERAKQNPFMCAVPSNNEIAQAILSISEAKDPYGYNAGGAIERLRAYGRFV